MIDTNPFANTRVTSTPQPQAPPPPSEKQVKFLTALARGAALKLDIAGLDAEQIEKIVAETVAEQHTRAMASAAIDGLVSQGIKPVWDPVTAPSVPEITEDGFYFDPNVIPTNIYKVQRAVHGSGKLYAKLLHLPKEGEVKGWWEYVGRGPLRKPLERLTLEKAKELGHLYGICCICGATLTNEKSIEAGIGPVCGGRI